MVHALEESWRVLKKGGILVDIRPYLGNMRVELITEDEASLAGLVDDSILMPDHEAVERTLSESMVQGLFKQEEEKIFDYEYLWESPQGLKDYVDENWTSRRLSRRLVERLLKMSAQAGDKSQVRIRDERVIARFRKLC